MYDFEVHDIFATLWDNNNFNVILRSLSQTVIDYFYDDVCLHIISFIYNFMSKTIADPSA